MAKNLNETYQEARAAALARLDEFDRLAPRSVRAWQLRRLGQQLRYAGERSPFYHARKRERAFPASLDSLDELARFPFTTKEDLRRHYPFGFLAAEPRDLIRYGESTGTTGDPTSSFITYADWIEGNVSVERALGRFFSPEDLAFIAIPYELTFASYDIDRALEQLGVTVVAVGTLNQICPFERMIAMMRVLHPTCLVCTPTRALRLFDMLQERGCDPLVEVGLRKLLYVGETCSPAKLGKIAALWQVELVTAYGSTETNSLALPCAENNVHLAEDRFCFEVIHPETGAPLPAGATGELVLTSLSARAMPLFRYRTGDLVSIEPYVCACGSSRRVLKHYGRVGERIEVAGRSLARIDLEEAVLAVPGTGLYYVAGEQAGALEVRVEIQDRDAEAICRQVEKRITEAFGLLASVRPVDRRTVTDAMDRMLKPGSVGLKDLEVPR